MKTVRDLFEFKFEKDIIENSSQTLRNVAIMSSGRSKNGRTYTQKAMQKVAQLVENCKCFLDHPSEDFTNSGQVRGIRDFAGQFFNARYSSGQVKSDLKVVKHHWNLLESLATMGASVGMSINAKVMQRTNEKGENIIEDIHSLKSVDVVSSPALTSGIFESHFDKLENKDIAESVQDFLLILRGRDPELENPERLKESMDLFLENCGGYK